MALTQISQAGAKDEAINEAKIQISNAGTNGQFLQKQSGNTGGLTWATSTDSTKVPLTGGTMTGSLRLNDDLELQIGTGSDLKIYHDGSNSYLVNTTGSLLIKDQSDVAVRTDAWSVNSFDNSESIFTGEKNSASRMYYDGSKKFETISDGVKFSGGRLYGEDDQKIVLGSGNDIQIYHSSGEDQFRCTGSKLEIRSPDIQLQNSGGEKYFRGVSDGAVELRYDNAKKFETTSYGVLISSRLNAQTISIEDWDSGNETGAVKLGTGNDLKIYHTGSHAYMTNTTGNWYLQPKSGETAIEIIPDGKVSLRYDGANKLETTSWGVDIHDTLRANDITLSDTHKIRLGSSDDLQIYHDGSNSRIKDVGTGYLILNTDTGVLIKNGADNENIAVFTPDGACELNYNNAKKFETKDKGIAIQSGQRECNLTLQNDARTWKVVNYDYGNNGTDHLGFHDGTTDRVIIQNTGGISFNGDTATANALDDYEEGDFTCRIGGQNNKDTYNQGGNAQYTKIGRLVYVHGYFAGIDIDNNASGQVQIYNLPFTPTFRSYGGAATADVHVSKVNFNTSRKQCWYIGTNGLAGYEARADDSHIDWPVSDFNRASTFIWFSAVYITTT